jgi:DNA-binding CsgD family transcriptional regulator
MTGAMDGLPERGVRAVLDLVGEAHDAQSLDEFRAVVLPSVRRIVRCDLSSYNEIADGQVVLATVTEPEVEPWAHEAWARHAGENPLVKRIQHTRDGRAYRFSDVISAKELERLPLYRELFVPLALAHQIAVTLPSPASITIGIALSRGGRDFTERDRQLLNLARPHLAQAYRNAKLRERTAGTVQALQRGLDDSGEALIVLDRDRRVAFASSLARALVRAATRRELREEGPLPEPLGSWAAGRRPHLPTAPLVVEAATPLLVRLIPGRSGELDVIVLERRGRTVGLSTLQAMSLTPREAEVLDSFVRGASTSDAAEQLDISPRTVHKHAQAIHAKLGVNGRSEAIAAAWAAAQAPE